MQASYVIKLTLDKTKGTCFIDVGVPCYCLSNSAIYSVNFFYEISNAVRVLLLICFNVITCNWRAFTPVHGIHSNSVRIPCSMTELGVSNKEKKADDTPLQATHLKECRRSSGNVWFC